MCTIECYKLKFGFPDGGRTPPLSACACLRSIVIQQHCMCGHVAYVCPCQFQVMTRRSTDVKIELIMRKGVPSELVSINKIFWGVCRVVVHSECCDRECLWSACWCLVFGCGCPPVFLPSSC